MSKNAVLLLIQIYSVMYFIAVFAYTSVVTQKTWIMVVGCRSFFPLCC